MYYLSTFFDLEIHRLRRIFTKIEAFQAYYPRSSITKNNFSKKKKIMIYKIFLPILYFKVPLTRG